MKENLRIKLFGLHEDATMHSMLLFFIVIFGLNLVEFVLGWKIGNVYYTTLSMTIIILIKVQYLINLDLKKDNNHEDKR